MSDNNQVELRFTRAKQALFDKHYSFLNDKQREAVYTVNNPLLVLAGAGSGKTTVLVHRIAHIIRYGNAYYENKPGITEEDAVRLENAINLPDEEIANLLSEYAVDPCPPWAMLTITFTNKAANEMKERLTKVIGEETGAGEIWAGTFHSICVRLLRRYGENIGLSGNFTIYDTDDSKKLIVQILKEKNIDDKVLPPKMVQNKISRAKDKLLTPEDMAGEAQKDFREGQIAKVYALYQARLKEIGAVDFDDIIVRTVELLTTSTETREYLQRHFRYVCIDEYQDTNHAQFVLATLLSGGRRNLMVVGDDDQSIYRFRGATIENILGFDQVFPDAKVIKLEQNYRSTQTILDAANAVIANNVGRKGKKLWTSKNSGEPIVLRKVANQSDEAGYIADQILAMCRDNGKKFSDFAILYRMNAQSNALEKVFSKSGVPYRVIGGTRFTDRKEIKDIVAYLTLILNPKDDLHLLRIINEPKRKIGTTTLNAIAEIARVEGVSMFEIIQKANQYVALQKSAANLANFASLIRELQRIAEKESLSSLFQKTIELSGYRDMLVAAGIAEQDRLENIQELVSNAIEYENNADEPSLSGFLEEYALVSDIDNYDKNADAVVMMTIHSAKGLEFPVVFLPGFEEGIFPGHMAMMDNNEMEEERRLAYVAITRARERLYCTHAKERMLFGRTVFNPISPFFTEIPGNLIVDTTVEQPKKVSNFEMPEYVKKKPAAQAIKEKTVFDMKPSAQTERFEVGEIVRHPNFGRGEILSVRPMSSDTLYEIAFDSVGTKKLMATYAKLKKAD
ncbi:MAG: ATP-dependent helicase [Eubacteriales bacterium]